MHLSGVSSGLNRLNIKGLRQIGLFLSTFLCLYVSIFYARPASTIAGQGGLVFSTWEGFEVDKCASIWLIKRYIDKNGAIKFFTKGEFINEGIPFDTPDAKFRRYHNMSTYECLLKHYRLKDQSLIYIGKIIHDIEVNTWERKIFEETLSIQEAVDQIIRNSINSDEVVEKSCKYFDSLYRQHSLEKGETPEK